MSRGIWLLQRAAKGEALDKVPEAGVAAEPADGDADKARAASMDNLKRLALAVHAYMDDHDSKFPNDITDKDGKLLLSWRIRLLPYLEQAELYKQFKLDQPWDSEANKKLLVKMPTAFNSPRVRVKLPGHTVYQGFAGPGSVFEQGQELRIFSITDGLSNTILAIESSVAVAWTKPVDLPFDEKKDLPDIGKAYGAKPLAVLCDGSVRTLDLTTLSATTLKAAITRAGGEVLGSDW